jgi:hypothetical protein
MILSSPAQMADAGRFQDYGKVRIPNANFISTENVLEEDRPKRELGSKIPSPN